MTFYPTRKSTDYIIIHHSLTKDGRVVNWQAIRNYHRGLGWIDVGYHFGLEKINGEVEILVGRPLLAVGAHTKQQNMNARSIGICVIGNYDEHKPAEEYYDKLIPLLAHLLKVFKLTPDRIKAHRDFASYKTCPGKAFDIEELAELVSVYGRF